MSSPTVSTKLQWIAEQAVREPGRVFTSLAHLIDIDFLKEAFNRTRKDGAPGIDEVTAEEYAENLEENLHTLHERLRTGRYKAPVKRVWLDKDDGGKRPIGMPGLEDKIVQRAVAMILGAVYEQDFESFSHGFREGHSQHQALSDLRQKCREIGVAWIVDADAAGFFETARHDILLGKVARRVADDKILRLLKMMLTTNGKKGAPQGGVISPLLANIYLNEVDTMLERTKAETGRSGFTYIEYARFADDLVILVDGYRRWDWLLNKVHRRLLGELAKLDLTVNEEKTRLVDLTKGKTFSFLGFDFLRSKTLSGKWAVRITPRMKARTNLLRNLKDIFRRHISQPIDRAVDLINPNIRGWLNYFRIGHASRCFSYIKDWVEKKVRRHLMRARKRGGFGWNRWSREWVYKNLGLYNDYGVRYYRPESAAGG